MEDVLVEDAHSAQTIFGSLTWRQSVGKSRGQRQVISPSGRNASERSAVPYLESQTNAFDASMKCALEEETKRDGVVRLTAMHSSKMRDEGRAGALTFSLRLSL